MIPRLVITDFDGTLLNDEKRITADNLTAMHKLRGARIKIAIATGRALSSFQKALADMGKDMAQHLPVDFVLFSTGSGVLDFKTGEIIYSRSLTANETVRVAQYFDRRRFDYMVHKAIPDTHHLLYKSFGKENTDFNTRLGLYSRHAHPLDVFTEQFKWVTEVLAIIPDHSGANTVVAIRKDLEGFSVIPATSPLDHTSLWIEVFHRDVSKSRTAAWLCRKLKIHPDEVLAVGNDFNDQDLLTWAGQGVVVDNAPLQLKSMFPAVRSNNCSGFAGAVSHTGL